MPAMFTGRWPHELSAGLADARSTATQPTLAEFLGSLATPLPASSPTTAILRPIPGLARGSRNTEIIIFPGLPPFKTAAWSIAPWRGFSRIGAFLESIGWSFDDLRARG